MKDVYALLKQQIQSNVVVSDAILATICSFFIPSTICKSKFLLKQSSVCKFEAFVNKGCFRVFTIDEKGNEKTLYFAEKGWWLMDVDSFLNQTPSDLNIQALEHSEVLFVNKADKQHLFDTYPVVEKWFRIMSQKALIAWQKRLVQNHCLTAAQRYAYFVETYPSIANKLTDRQIASYLGITHEFLSKIKKKMTE